MGYRMKVEAEERAKEARTRKAEEQDQEDKRLEDKRLHLAKQDQLDKIDRERRNAAAKAEEERQKELERLLSVADQENTRRRLERQEAARKAVQTQPAKLQEVAVYNAAMRRAAQLAERRQPYELRLTLDRFRPKPRQPDLRAWEWHFLDALRQSQESGPVRLLFRRRIHDVPQGIADRPEVAWAKGRSPLAVLDTHGDVHILDPVTGAEDKTLHNRVRQDVEARFYRHHPFAVSPDGLWVAQTFTTSKGLLNLKLWDLTKGIVAREFGEVSKAVSWSPDGRLLYLGGERLWNMARSSEERLPGPLKINCCASWSPDGSSLATGSTDRLVRFWDPVNCRELREPLSLEQAAEAIAWSPAGKWIATAAGDKISVWDTQTRKQVWTLLYSQYNNPRYRLTWSLDGQRLLVYGGGGAWPQKLLDGATGREIFSADSAAAYCPDGKRLAVLSIPPVAGPDQQTPTVLIMESDSGREILQIGGVERGTLSWSPDGSCLALASVTGILQMWSIASPADPKNTLPLPAGAEPAWSRDGLRCAFASGDFGSGQVRIHTLAQPEIGVVAPRDPAQATERYIGAQISKIAWCPDGKYVATAHGSEMYLWEVASGKRLWRLAGHTKVTGGVFIERGNRIHALAWAPGGRWLASASDNGTIKVWDTATGKEACNFDTGEDGELSWSGDGKYLAASSFGGLTRVWELPTGKVVHSLNRVGQAVMSPDSKFLAVAVAGGVKLWEVASGRELQPLNSGEQSNIGRILGWSPDARYLVYSANNTHIWDVPARTRNDVTGSAHTAAWDPDGKKVLLGFGSVDYWRFKAFDPQTSAQVRDFGKVSVGIAQNVPPKLLWTKEGPKLATGHEIRYGPQGPRVLLQLGPNSIGEKSAEDGVVQVVDLASGKSRFTARVLQAEPTPSMNRIGEKSAEDGVVQQVDLESEISRFTARVLRAEPTSSMNVLLTAFAWKPDGTAFATVHQDAALRLWHPVKGELLSKLTTTQQVNNALMGPPYPSKASLAWTANGQRIAFARNNAIQVWDLTDEKKSQAFQAEPKPLNGLSFQSLAWNPDNRRLAALANRGQDVVVNVWDTSGWREIRSFNLEGTASSSAVQLLFWSPDGNRLAAGVQAIHVWEIETAKELFELSGHTVPLQRLEWSDDGQRIISRAAARPKGNPAVLELIVWDAELGDQVLKLTGPSAEYRTSPDWKWLAVPFADNGVSRLQRIGALDK
jgi:WD40 repeat protein